MIKWGMSGTLGVFTVVFFLTVYLVVFASQNEKSTEVSYTQTNGYITESECEELQMGACTQVVTDEGKTFWILNN